MEYQQLKNAFIDHLINHYEDELKRNDLKTIIESSLSTFDYYFLYYFFWKELNRNISKLNIEYGNSHRRFLIHVQDPQDYPDSLPIEIPGSIIDSNTPIFVKGKSLKIILPENCKTLPTNKIQIHPEAEAEIILPKSLEKICPNAIVSTSLMYRSNMERSTRLNEKSLPNVKFLFTPVNEETPFEIFNSDRDFFKTHLKIR